MKTFAVWSSNYPPVTLVNYKKKKLNVLALIEKGVFRNGWTERLNTLISLAWPYPTSRLRVW